MSSTADMTPTLPAPPAYTSTPSGHEKFVDDGITRHDSLTPAPLATKAPEKPKVPYSPDSYIDDGGLPEVVVPVVMPTMEVDSGLIPTTPTPTPSSPIPRDEMSVTPLHLLGDQSDTIDCPFCRRRTETRVKKKPSIVTHTAAATLFLTTLGGAVAPYATHWKADIHHYCTNCDRKVAWRRYNQENMIPLGTPEHLKVASQYPAAEKSRK